jgi:hypothetical protein
MCIKGCWNNINNKELNLTSFNSNKLNLTEFTAVNNFCHGYHETKNPNPQFIKAYPKSVNLNHLKMIEAMRLKCAVKTSP